MKPHPPCMSFSKTSACLTTEKIESASVTQATFTPGNITVAAAQKGTCHQVPYTSIATKRRSCRYLLYVGAAGMTQRGGRIGCCACEWTHHSSPAASFKLCDVSSFRDISWPYTSQLTNHITPGHGTLQVQRGRCSTCER